MGLRITFVLPHLSLSGGTMITLTYADGLAARGHDVTVVHGQMPRLKDRIAGSLFRGRGEFHHRRTKVRMLSARGAPASLPGALPDADVLIASWWETVEAVSGAPQSKGRKIHHVQGHEVFSYLPARSASVYRLPSHKIAVSNWLRDLMKNTYGCVDVDLVLNPVDTTRFGWSERSLSPTPMVGTVYSAAAVKNSEMAWEAVRLAREQIPDLKLLCFGADPLPKALSAAPFVEFHFKPGQAIIPDLYRSCDYWLFTSSEEGFGLPILEAMAVGTPVIATPAGAAPDLVNAKTGALVDSIPARWRRRFAAC